jgi:hypothetical protein
VPSLFSICATAQSNACAGALEQAMGVGADPAVLALRRRLVDAETLREHLWRILLDWPRYLDLPPDAAAMARVMDGYMRLRAALTAGCKPWELGGPGGGADMAAASQLRAELAALVEQQVLGLAPAKWLDAMCGSDRLAAWCDRTDTVAARLVRRLLARDLADLGRTAIGALPGPELDPFELDARLCGPAADDFVARPTWGGTPRESSPLTRHLEAPLIEDMAGRFGNGILTRLAAQLLEVARLVKVEAGEVETRDRLSGRPTAPKVAAGVGLAQVSAARGLLTHRVQVAAGRVEDYRILAPTEWNFHPHGVVVAGLDDLRSRLDSDELGPLTRLFIAAVDPCVDYELILT